MIADVNVAFEVAVEHAAWAIRDGQHPRDVLMSLGVMPPKKVTWNDVIWALAQRYDLAAEIRQRAAQRPERRAA